MIRFITILFTAATIVTDAALAGAADRQPPELRARPPIVKPERTALESFHRSDLIMVKFVDDLPIRLREGRLTDIARSGAIDAHQPILNDARTGRWQRLTATDEAMLDELRHRAQQTLSRAVADMNTEFFYFLGPDEDAASLIDALNALEIVELARPAPVPPPDPVMAAGPGVPNFQPNQGYLLPAPTGVDAAYAWDVLGTRGEGVQVVDIETWYNANHLDLPNIPLLGPNPNQWDGNHGTAVLGQIVSTDNGWGTTGISPDSQAYFAGATINGVWSVASAMFAAMPVLEPGDIILIEQQYFGPNYGGGQNGMVPVEWQIAEYNAIVTAVGNGIVVIAAAGNGQEDLDAPIYSQGNNGHWPFLPENDSGSILVGGGAAPTEFGGSDVPRSKLWYSNYGSRVNVQGWGERVWTTGYGGAYWQGGVNLYYTGTFSGTSSASPIATGAAMLLQAAHVNKYGVPLTSTEMREALIATGVPQQAGQWPVSAHIGPQPDVAAAAAWLNLTPNPADLNNDGHVDVQDLLILLGAWGPCANCAACPADIDENCAVDVQDLLILLANWG